MTPWRNTSEEAEGTFCATTRCRRAKVTAIQPQVPPGRAPESAAAGSPSLLGNPPPYRYSSPEVRKGHSSRFHLRSSSPAPPPPARKLPSFVFGSGQLILFFETSSLSPPPPTFFFPHPIVQASQPDPPSTTRRHLAVVDFIPPPQLENWTPPPVQLALSLPAAPCARAVQSTTLLGSPTKQPSRQLLLPPPPTNLFPSPFPRQESVSRPPQLA